MSEFIKPDQTSGERIIKLVVIAIGATLLFSPFLFQDVRSLEVVARICVFIVLVASYDLLIGYTGIVSFAHTMFFGFGAYGAAVALKHMVPGWDAVLIGGLSGLLMSLVMAIAIGLLSLRVKAIFFAMVTLAVASVALVLASQLSTYIAKRLNFDYILSYDLSCKISPSCSCFSRERGFDF